jgi:hypothetical protein
MQNESELMFVITGMHDDAEGICSVSSAAYAYMLPCLLSPLSCLKEQHEPKAKGIQPATPQVVVGSERRDVHFCSKKVMQTETTQIDPHPPATPQEMIGWSCISLILPSPNRDLRV